VLHLGKPQVKHLFKRAGKIIVGAGLYLNPSCYLHSKWLKPLLGVQSPPTRTSLLVRVAKSAVLGFPQVEHLFKTGGLCNMSHCLVQRTLRKPQRDCIRDFNRRDSIGSCDYELRRRILRVQNNRIISTISNGIANK
jgi:hypothetical protein